MTNDLPQSDLGKWKVAAIALSLSAAAVAGYLCVVSFQLRGTPWGCGAGSGCADVLKSRWSNVAGIPVGFFALAAYLGLAMLSGFSGLLTDRRSSTLLAVLAAAILSSAIYFVLMQLVVIQAICPWCMFDHALGSSAAVAAFVVSRRQTPRVPAGAVAKAVNDDPLAEYGSTGTPVVSSPPGRRQSAASSIAAGVMLSLAFVVVQHLTARAPAVARIESEIDASGGPAGELKLSLKNGDVALTTAMLPRLGLEVAPRRLILLFDYCCPHCREAHSVIRRLQPLARDEWQILFVPAPLNRDCNPAIEETEPRFRDACELARLSLAVWKLKPADWPAFDAWLFEPEVPRTAAEAKDHASALYGELEVAEALIDPSIDQAIRSNVGAYQASGGRVLPLILSPGTTGIAGRTDGEQELRELLEREFEFPTPLAP